MRRYRRQIQIGLMILLVMLCIIAAAVLFPVEAGRPRLVVLRPPQTSATTVYPQTTPFNLKLSMSIEDDETISDPMWDVGWCDQDWRRECQREATLRCWGIPQEDGQPPLLWIAITAEHGVCSVQCRASSPSWTIGTCDRDAPNPIPTQCSDSYRVCDAGCPSYNQPRCCSIFPMEPQCPSQWSVEDEPTSDSYGRPSPWPEWGR